MTGSNNGESFIEAVNAAAIGDAVAMLEPIFERSPWLTRKVADARPFVDLHDLAERIGKEIVALPPGQRLTLLCAHPELSPPAPSLMTDASQREQARLSISHPSGDIATRLRALNDRFRARHGFPFIIALHAAEDIDSILEQFDASLGADTQAEITRALGEVVSIATARLTRLAHRVSDDAVECQP